MEPIPKTSKSNSKAERPKTKLPCPGLRPRSKPKLTERLMWSCYNWINVINSKTQVGLTACASYGVAGARGQ